MIHRAAESVAMAFGNHVFPTLFAFGKMHFAFGAILPSLIRLGSIVSERSECCVLQYFGRFVNVEYLTKAFFPSAAKFVFYD